MKQRSGHAFGYAGQTKMQGANTCFTTLKARYDMPYFTHTHTISNDMSECALMLRARKRSTTPLLCRGAWWSFCVESWTGDNNWQLLLVVYERMSHGDFSHRRTLTLFFVASALYIWAEYAVQISWKGFTFILNTAPFGNLYCHTRHKAKLQVEIMARNR